MIIKDLSIYIGYDSKEDIAYRVCKNSLINTSSIALNIQSLKLYELVSKKLYTRNIDPLASTEFTYSRFLVPALMNYKGWAIFCDCDFLFFASRRKKEKKILKMRYILKKFPRCARGLYHLMEK